MYALRSLLVIILLLIIFFIFWGLDNLFGYVLPCMVADAITWILIYYVLYELCRGLTFPGSTFMWRRQLETAYMRAFAKKSLAKMDLLQLIVNILLTGKQSELLRNEHKSEFLDIRRLLISLNHAFSKIQNDYKRMSKYQQTLSTLLSDIEQGLQESYIISSDQALNIPLWSSLEDGNVLYIMLKNNKVGLRFKDESQGKKLLENVSAAKTYIDSLLADLKWYKAMFRWLKNDSLGSIDHMRVELETRYNSQRITIKSYDNTNIDCMFLLGKQVDSLNVSGNDMNASGSYSMTENSLGDRDKVDVGPTVIFCNPNAGIYEFMFFDNDWIDFYVNRGVNVFLWNYRGYGLSQGSPTPKRIVLDGEAIVDYLRNTMNVKKVGIHGESLGGLVATYVARSKTLDFMCADRTLASLFDVVKFSYNHGLGWLHYFITFWWWHKNLGHDYIESTCYKIVTCDPRDELIPTLASLPTGITEEILRRRFVRDKLFGFFYPRYPLLNKMIKCLPFTNNCLGGVINRKEANEYVKNYSLNILSSSDYNILYFALQRIFHLVIDLTNRNNEIKSKSNTPVISPKRDDDEETANPSPRPEMGDPALIIGGQDDEGLTEVHLQSERPSDFSSEKDASTSLRELKMLNEQKPDYQMVFDTQEHIEQLHAFILRVFSLFEMIDSAGCTLNDIFGKDVKNREELFKIFLVNLEIWGSWLPIKIALKSQANGIDFHHQLALFKLNEFVKKLESFVASESKTELSALTKNILDDLQIVSKKAKLIRERIRQNLGFKSRDGSNNSISLTVGDTNVNASVINEKNGFIEKGNLSSEANPFNIDDLRKHVGFLLPLSCGHNGNLNKQEIQVFEHHLVKANFIK